MMKTEVLKSDSTMLPSCCLSQAFEYLGIICAIRLFNPHCEIVSPNIHFRQMMDIIIVDYYLEDIVEMLSFVPPPNDRKRKRDKEETILPDDDAEKDVCYHQ